MPVRVQLMRTKGWMMPPNTVKVDRTTKWGNPFIVGQENNMTFRFYITNLHAGLVQGTDDAQEARDFAECDDFFVVDSETGHSLTPGGGTRAVEAIS